MDLKITDELTWDYTINLSAYTSPEGDGGPAKTFIVKRIIYGFSIVDADGTKYVFGKSPNSIEFSADASVLSDTFRPNFIAKAWYLTKIILPNKREIEFNYSFDNKATFKLYKNFEMLSYSVNATSVSNSSSTPAHSSSLIRNFSFICNPSKPLIQKSLFRSPSLTILIIITLITLMIIFHRGTFMKMIMANFTNTTIWLLSTTTNLTDFLSNRSLPII